MVVRRLKTRNFHELSETEQNLTNHYSMRAFIRLSVLRRRDHGEERGAELRRPQQPVGVGVRAPEGGHEPGELRGPR